MRIFDDVFSYVFCMFYRSSMLNQLSNFAPLCRFRRCAPCHLGSEPSNDPPEGSRGEGHWCSAERQLHLLLRHQVAVVHTDHKILHEPKTDWIWLSHWVFFPTDMCKKVMKMHKTPKLVELCGTPGHLKRKKNLSSKHCNCSKAQPRWPILRPDCELSDPPRPYHQVPSPPQPLTWQANKPKLQCPQCPGETARKR